MGSVAVELSLGLSAHCGRICSVTTVTALNYLTLTAHNKEAVDHSLLFREIMNYKIVPQISLLPRKEV